MRKVIKMYYYSRRITDKRENEVFQTVYHIYIVFEINEMQISQA